MNYKHITLLGLILLLLTCPLKAQKKNTTINMEKVAYVADLKTEELDNIVQLEKNHQKKSIYKIYSNYEIKKQNLLIRPIEKHQRSHSTYIHRDKDKKHNIQSEEILNKQLEKKINQQLTPKQKKKLANHRKTESEIIQM